MKRLAQSMVAVALVLVANVAMADTKAFPEAGVSVDLPAGWKVGNENGMTTVLEPKEEAAIMIFSVEGEKAQETLGQLDAMLGKMATDVKWPGKPQEVTVNGMKGFANKGTAVVDKKEAQLGILVLKTPNGKALFLLGMVEMAKKEAHRDNMNAVMGSVKPAK